MCWENSIHPGFGPGSIEESITTWTLAVWWMLSWYLMIDLSCVDISRNTIDRVYFSFWLQQNTHFLCVVDTYRLWGTTTGLSLALNAAISLSSVSLSSCDCPCHKFIDWEPSYIKSCLLLRPFWVLLFIEWYPVATDGSLSSSSVIGVESCLLPSIRIKPCQVFNTSIVTPPWLLVSKKAHTLTLQDFKFLSERFKKYPWPTQPL